jgi:hypothetical protein
MPQGTVSAPIKIKGGAMSRHTSPEFTTMPVNRTPKKFNFEGTGTGRKARYQESQKDVTTQDYINGVINAQKTLASGRVKGYGATGKMLKNAAANATAGLISSGSSRAIHEMDTRGKKGAGFKKGSQAAKDHMARIRAMRKTK